MSQQGSLERGGQHSGSCTMAASAVVTALVLSFIGLLTRENPHFPSEGWESGVSRRRAGIPASSVILNWVVGQSRGVANPPQVFNLPYITKLTRYTELVAAEPLFGSVVSAWLGSALALRASQYFYILLETSSRSSGLILLLPRR